MDRGGIRITSRALSHQSGAAGRVLSSLREWCARPRVSPLMLQKTKIKETFKQTNINQSVTGF